MAEENAPSTVLAEAKQADLVIRYHKAKAQFEFINSRTGQSKPFPSSWDPSKSKDFAETLRDTLEALVLAGVKHLPPDAPDDDDIDYAALEKPVQGLWLATQALNFDLFQKRGNEVQRFIRDACPGWDNDGAAPLVQVEASVDDLPPLEILPILEFSLKPPRVHDFTTLAQAFRPFLGFSAVVQRVDSRYEIAQCRTIDNRARLPMKFFHDQTLPAAQDEWRFFERNAAAFDLDGGEPWPGEAAIADVINDQGFAEQLATHLWGERANPDDGGAATRPPDEIHHFSCHCATDPLNANEYTITLGRQDRRFAVQLGTLKALFNAASGTRTSDRPLPLVILCGCGSAVIDPFRLTSFPKLFLDSGNRGFIGTLARVPDRFAAQFTVRFYARLMRGEPLSNAIYGARRAMLEGHSNPLGILYTLYADPSIVVTKPMTLTP